MRWGEGLVRLSLRPRGGQGHPYGDDVVALVRSLVEATTLSHAQIGERVGVSHMTVCRWRKAGKWRRPAGAGRAPGQLSRRWSTTVRFDQRAAPWERLAEAEDLLDTLEREEGLKLARLEEVLTLLSQARHWMERRGGNASVSREDWRPRDG